MKKKTAGDQQPHFNLYSMLLQHPKPNTWLRPTVRFHFQQCFFCSSSFPSSLFLDIYGGYVCFVVSIFAIGVVTAVIGDVASHFGCTLGIKDSVTAIVFVALGTSVPGLYFYSMFVIDGGVVVMLRRIGSERKIKRKKIRAHFSRNWNQMDQMAQKIIRIRPINNSLKTTNSQWANTEECQWAPLLSAWCKRARDRPYIPIVSTCVCYFNVFGSYRLLSGCCRSTNSNEYPTIWIDTWFFEWRQMKIGYLPSVAFNGLHDFPMEVVFVFPSVVCNLFSIFPSLSLSLLLSFPLIIGPFPSDLFRYVCE